jgi:Kdo2-lipid IVA lauroyltransferase/acyltransferase
MARRRTKSLELWLSRHFLHTLVGLTQCLGHRSATALGAGLGELSYHLFPRYRRVALANLRRAFGETWGAREIEQTAHETFCNVGRTLLEFVRIPATSPAELERLLRFEGLEHLTAALARGRGALLITAHFGNWELAGAGLVQNGYRINVIARTMEDAVVNRTINAIRARAGYFVFERARALRPALECLRRNEVLALLIDQNALTSNVWVDFFGWPAATHTGAAVIARRTGAALVPMFDHRLPDGTHLARVQAPLFVTPTDDKEGDIREMTARLTRIIEDEVRDDPAQWLWLHNRWKHQPEPGKYRENPARDHAVEDCRR